MQKLADADGEQHEAEQHEWAYVRLLRRDEPLRVLVRTLARQAAREVFARELAGLCPFGLVRVLIMLVWLR